MSVDRLYVLKSICVVVSSVLSDDMFVVRTYVCTVVMIVYYKKIQVTKTCIAADNTASAQLLLVREQATFRSLFLNSRNYSIVKGVDLYNKRTL
jgi:hypothetical protein